MFEGRDLKALSLARVGALRFGVFGRGLRGLRVLWLNPSHAPIIDSFGLVVVTRCCMPQARKPP